MIVATYFPFGAGVTSWSSRPCNATSALSHVSTSYLPSSISFSYDSNGNLIGDGRRCFAYDDENQLSSVWVTNAWRSDFVYDGKMRRRIRREYSWLSGIGNWQLAKEVRYVYDGNLVIQERDANNLPLVTYARGRDLSGSLQGAGGIGGLLARTDRSTLNPQLSTAFYHADGNGNITCLVNAKQALMAKYLYDPYGNILSQSGPLAEANTYRFSSKEFHVASGLVYYLYRFYEPSLQRWLNRDPIEEAGGLNLYSFSGNNPISEVDPYGYSSIPITVTEAIASGNVAQMQALLDLAAELGLSEASKAALRAAIAAAAAGAVVSGDRCESRGHTKGKRESTRGKHEEGDARRGRDQGGERGDARRDPKDPPPRGPKPPKPPYPPNKGPKQKNSLSQSAVNPGAEFVLVVVGGKADWQVAEYPISNLWPRVMTPSKVA